MNSATGSAVPGSSVGARSTPPGAYSSQTSAQNSGRYGSVSEPGSLRGGVSRGSAVVTPSTQGSAYGSAPLERSRFHDSAQRSSGLSAGSASGQLGSRASSMRDYDLERGSTRSFGQMRAQSSRLGLSSAALDPYGPAPSPGAASVGATGLPPAPTPDLSTAYAKPRTEGGIFAATRDSWKAFKARVKSDIWKVAVVKATNHVISEPKEKHVQVILRGTYMGGSVMDKLTPAGAILHQLGKRLQWKDWIVVLKATIVFHRIFQDGNPAFVSFLAHNASNIFRFHGFIEQTSDAIMNMPLILSYSQYLERWCVTKQKVDWPERIHDASPYAMPAMGFMAPGMNGLPASGPLPSYGRDVSSTNSGRVRGPSRFQECDFLQLVEEVPYLQDNLDLLLAVRLEFGNSNSPPARGAVRLCLRDLVELLPALANAIQNLVEQFYNVDTPEILESAFEIYRRYLDQDIGVAQYLKLCQSLGLNQAMPNVARPSQSILDEMFDHMERVKMGDIPRIRGDELDSNDQEISSDNLEGDASKTQGAPDSLKETAAQTVSAVDANASKTVGSGPDAAPMNKSINVAATQTEENNQEVVSRKIPAIAQTSSTAAPALEQKSAFPEEEEAQSPRAELELATRHSVREKAAPALENREPSKPKEFDLLALLEGSSDSDEQIASESDSSASESRRKDVQAGVLGAPAGARSGKHRGENATSKPSLRQQKAELEGSAPNTESFAAHPAGYGARPEFASQGGYGMYPPPPPHMSGAYAGMHPVIFGPPGYPPQFIPPPTPYVQPQGPPSQGDSANGAPMYFPPIMQPQLAMQQYPFTMAPFHAPALPPPSFSGSGTPQNYGGTFNAPQSFARDSDQLQRKVTPADQHFFDLFEEARPKK